MKDETLLKAATGFTGGIGGMRDACGGLTGAVMMLGTVFGRGQQDLKSRDKITETNERVGRLYKWFQKEFGSATCYDIRTRFGGGVYYDTHVPWQAELAEQAGVMDKCKDLVQKTTARTAELILEGEEPEKKN